MENPNFLKQKYWPKEEFRKATDMTAKRAEKRTGEKVPQKPEARIENYLKRFQEIFDREDPADREHGIGALKRLLYSRYTIKPENISDDYIKGVIFGNFAELKGYERDDLKNEEIRKQIKAQFKKEIGQDFERYSVPDEEKEKVREMAVKDQKTRLGVWLDYLTSPEAKNISTVFRYWAFAEMLKLGDYDRSRQVYNERTKTTVANFPELDQQALAMVFDETRRKLASEPQAIQLEDKDKQKEFKKLLKNENFGQLYAFMLEHVNSLRLPTERLIITDGEWKLFPKGSSAKELAEPLQGFNTKWCIAGEGTAEGYLTHSDMWIYFSQDDDKKNKIPRACIVDSKELGITEVRGIISNGEAKQHLDDYIAPIVDEKLGELPGGERWRDNMRGMKKLARLHLKHLSKESLNKEDLIFIYEIDQPIQATGYGRDPRIEEIRKSRNPKEDAPVVFECRPEEIAYRPDDINKNAKAYIGELKQGIFNLIKKYHIERVYTSFPEGKITRFEADLGGESEKEIIDVLEERENLSETDRDKIYVSDYAKQIIRNKDFYMLKNKERASFVKLKVAGLGFSSGATIQQIYDRAEELGLELCPPESGPKIRLHYEEIFKREQPMGEFFVIATKQISGFDGRPLVFAVGRYGGGGSWLDGRWARPEHRWDSGGEFVFRLRKFDS